MRSSFCWGGLLILKEAQEGSRMGQKGREREVSPGLLLSADAPQSVFSSVPWCSLSVLLLPSPVLYT